MIIKKTSFFDKTKGDLIYMSKYFSWFCLLYQ